MRKFWNNLGINRRGVLAVCLAFALILSLLPQAFGSAEEAQAEDPNLTITAVGVDNTYVELGLNIQAQQNDFRSVGAVVSYDPALLTPVDWAEQPTAVTLTAAPADADIYTEEEARAEWNSVATALETKGPDELSGKTALAFVKGETDAVGYLYLSAEAPKLIDGATTVDDVLTGGWNQPLPENTPLTEGEGEEAAAVTTANGVPVVIPVTSPVEAPVEQSVVVRFKLKGDDMAAALASIDLATGGAAVGSPVHDDSGVAYFYNNKGDSLPVNVQILRAEDGTTYFSGGSGGPVNMDGILSIAFYDWDETLLGILAVPAGEDISQRVNDYVRQFIHPNLNDTVEDGETLDDAQIKTMMASIARADTYRGKYPSTYGDNNTIDPSGSSYPLTNKLDYVFYKGDTTAEDYDGYYFAHGWIPVTTETLDGRAENGVFTAYTSAEEAKDANPVDFSKGLTESIMVKAAYVPGEDLDTTLETGMYTITNIAYNRYGIASETEGSYSMIATVERVNSDGYGVTRLRWPAFRMYVTPDAENAQDVAVRIDVDSKDETTAEIVSPKGSTKTKFNFIDVTSENWLNVELKAAAYEIPRDGEQGYLILGTVRALNAAVSDLYNGIMIQADFMTLINEATYTDLGLTITNVTVGGNRLQRFNVARNKLLLGYVASCGQEMNLDYIEGILYMKLNSPLNNINTPANYNTALANVQKAVAANGNQPLSVEQTAYAINNGGALLSAETQ